MHEQCLSRESGGQKAEVGGVRQGGGGAFSFRKKYDQHIVKGRVQFACTSLTTPGMLICACTCVKLVVSFTGMGRTNYFAFTKSVG